MATKGPINPDDREPSSDRNQFSAFDNAWTDVLRALQSLERKDEQKPPAQTDRIPDLPPPVEPASTHYDTDEALDALQGLTRRYNAGGASREVTPTNAEYADPHPDYQLPADSDDPAREARTLKKRPARALIALILVCAAVLTVLLVGALSLSRQTLYGQDTRTDRTPARGQDLVITSLSTVNAVPIAKTAGVADLPIIEKAMEDCDIEAKKNQDALYFVIIPLSSPTKNYQPWMPLSVGEIGTSIILLHSKDALDGLRIGSLSLFQGQYRFAIIDSSTEAVYDWSFTTGVSTFVKRDAAQISGFRMRFGFGDSLSDTLSSFRFPRGKGECYWVGALWRGLFDFVR